MVQPQAVHKKPTTAARFEGGNVSANQIIQWARHNGDNAVHHEREDHGDYGKGEVLLIEQKLGGKIDVLPGTWIVHEDGRYMLYMEDLFVQIFQADQLISPERDRWQNALKVMTQGSMPLEEAEIAAGVWGAKQFRLAKPEVEAIQFPTKQLFEADKDYEERVRKVAAFIVNNGGEVTDQGKDFLGIDLNASGEDTLRDAQWIVKGWRGHLEHLSDDEFRTKYEAV